MEFVLNEYHRNVSDEELLEDMKRVAKQLNKETISRDDYKKHGKYSYSTFQKRFGGWNKAITLCGMTLNPLQLAAAQSTYQYGNISNEDLFSDILRVCSQLGKETISSGEYNKHGMYSTHTCFKRFGTWEETLLNAGIKPYVTSIPICLLSTGLSISLGFLAYLGAPIHQQNQNQ